MLQVLNENYKSQIKNDEQFIIIGMEINTIAQQLRSVIYEYASHNDFTSEGNAVFKQKQKNLIQYNQSSNSDIIAACLLLLQNDQNDHIRFFTTMILKDKLKYNFYQLTHEKIAQTHIQLVALIRHIATPTKPVLSNLALCLVYIYIHCVDNIGTVMNFFATTFPNDSNTSQGSRFLYFFKYLEMLPDQIHNSKLVIDEQARTHVFELLKKQQTEIISEMHQVYSNFNTGNMTMLEKAVLIDAFANWLEITQPEEAVIAALPTHSIMNLAIGSFNNDHLSAPAMRCLMAAVNIMRNPQKNKGLFEFLGKNLFSLMNEVETQIREELLEPAENIINVLCDYGSYSAQIFVDSYNQEVQMFVLKMLQFTELDELDVFKGLIDFWECFIHYMSQRNQSSSMSQQTGYHIIAKIYSAFCTRIQFSKEDIEDLNLMSESKLQKLHKSVEDTLDRREEARYIFEKVANYLGKVSYVKEVLNVISNLSPTNQKYWAILQSHIFSLRDAVQEYPTASQQICQIVLLFQKIQQSPIALKRSFLRIFQSLFSIKDKNEQFILKILHYTSMTLGEPLLESKADKAFIKCCSNNAPILIKHLSSLFVLFEMYPNREDISNGIIIVLRNYPDILNQRLPELLKVPINNLVNAQEREGKKLAFSTLISLVTSIPSSKNSGNENLLEDLLQKMWPFLKEVLSNPVEKADSSDSLVEKSMKFLKLVMRKIPNQFMKYLKDIFEVMVNTYTQYPIGSYLYFFQATFATYYESQDPEIYEFIKNLYVEYCRITAMHFAKNQNIISENQRLVDDFLGLSKRLITFHLRMFLESGQFESVLKFSITCLGSNIPRPASTASQMFEIIFMIYWSPYSRKKWIEEDVGEAFNWKSEDVEIYNQLKEFLIPSIPNLITQMFSYLESGNSDSASKNIEDCLMAIALAFPDKSQDIWIQPLQSLGEDILTRTQKEKLLNWLTKMRSDRQDQFLVAESHTKKMIFLISRRFRNRSSRSKLQAH